jgi:hypothetical protein
VFAPILFDSAHGYIEQINLYYSDRVAIFMAQYHTTKGSGGDDDLSGCLASGFLSKQPPRTAKIPPPPPPPRKPVFSQNDDDLSGCLASGFLTKQTPRTPTYRQVTIDNSGDLSGCLSGVLKARKTTPKTIPPKKTPVEIELDDSPASDWFYLN